MLDFLFMRVLLVPVESSDGLPTHNNHFCVGEVEGLKWKLKDSSRVARPGNEATKLL